MLIFDIGLHKGEDTARYLGAGHEVVAIEANPVLVAHCRQRFATEIDTGRLTIVEGAISPGSGETVTFHVNEKKSEWGTVRAEWAERNRVIYDADSSIITVPRVDLAAIIEQYGVPDYCKIDVEGMDHHCLDVLAGFASRPRFVSIEADRTSYSRMRAEIDALCRLGYTRFRIVQQRFHPEGATGAFGDQLSGPWLRRRPALFVHRLLLWKVHLLGERNPLHRLRLYRALCWRLERMLRVGLPGWYDTHARS